MGLNTTRNITHEFISKSVASLGGGGDEGADRPGKIPSRGDTRLKLIFLWLNVERKVDKERRRNVGAVIQRKKVYHVPQGDELKKGRQFF